MLVAPLSFEQPPQHGHFFLNPKAVEYVLHGEHGRVVVVGEQSRVMPEGKYCVNVAASQERVQHWRSREFDGRVAGNIDIELLESVGPVQDVVFVGFATGNAQCFSV